MCGIGVFPDNFGGDIGFQHIIATKKEIDLRKVPPQIIGLLPEILKKLSKKHRNYWDYLWNKLESNKILMYSTPGTAQVSSHSQQWTCLIKSILISRLSSQIPSWKLATIFCSSGWLEWSWCHYGWQISFPSSKCFFILWFVTVRVKRCQNQEEMWWILWKSLTVLLLKTCWTK